MNVSEAVQVFVLIYVLIIAGLYLTAKLWSPLLAKAWQALGFVPSAAAPTALHHTFTIPRNARAP